MMKKIVESWNDKKELWNHGIMKKIVESWNDNKELWNLGMMKKMVESWNYGKIILCGTMKTLRNSQVSGI
jgi:hypothetical protein